MPKLTGRRYAIVAGLILLTCTATGALFCAGQQLQQPPHPVRVYDHIRLGMTLGEITSVIGVPPGDYAQTARLCGGGTYDPITRVHEAGLRIDREPPPPRSAEQWVWIGHRIWVTFDENGRADGTTLLKTPHEPPPPPTFFERLRSWLGW